MYLVHNNFKDVFIEVLQINGSRTLIRWWNLGFDGNPWIVPVRKGKFTGVQEKQWVDTANLVGMVEFDPNMPENHPGRKHVLA